LPTHFSCVLPEDAALFAAIFKPPDLFVLLLRPFPFQIIHRIFRVEERLKPQ